MLKRYWRKFLYFTGLKKRPSTRNDRIDKPIDTITDDLVKGSNYKYKRIAIVVGHTESSSGTSTYKHTYKGKLKRVREYDWNNDRAKEIKEYIDTHSEGIACKIFYRDGVGMKGAGKATAKWGADFVIMLHINSVGDKYAIGSEFILNEVYEDTQCEKDARKILDYLLAEFPNRRRHDKGIKWIERKKRGWYNGYYHRKYNKKLVFNGLIEPFFAGHRHPESQQYLEGNGPEKYSKTLAKAILSLKE